MTAKKKRWLRHAENDTPPSVKVPESWAGIVQWMIGRHGPITVAVVFVTLLYLDTKKFQTQLYEDNKLMQGQVLAAFQTQTRVGSETALALVGLKDAVNTIRKESDEAHRNP